MLTIMITLQQTKSLARTHTLTKPSDMALVGIQSQRGHIQRLSGRTAFNIWVMRKKNVEQNRWVDLKCPLALFEPKKSSIIWKA